MACEYEERVLRHIQFFGDVSNKEPRCCRDPTLDSTKKCWINTQLPSQSLGRSTAFLSQKSDARAECRGRFTHELL